MFTGLVEATGVLRKKERRGPGIRTFIEVDLDLLGQDPLKLGESVAVDGVCLTVDTIAERGFEADMSAETLARTTLGDAAIGARVHLERATPLGGRMGGHMVLGHVDGVGRVRSVTSVGDSKKVELSCPGELGQFVAEKGSICIDGVSLTVNGVAPGLVAGAVVFDVMLVPHTLTKTTFGGLTPGHPINIEVDVLARYVARQHTFGGTVGAQPDDNADDRLLAKLEDGGYT